MFWTVWILLGGALVGPFGPQDRALPKSVPHEVGLSAERLERIDAMLRAHVETGDLPGAVALIARRGRVAWSSSVGWANLECGVPMRADTLFRIASMTKLASTVAALQLYEEGAFTLNEPASRFLPELAEMEVVSEYGSPVPARNAITIRDLLRHTAGMSYGSGREPAVDPLYQAAGIRGWQGDLPGFVGAIGQLPLLFEPGTRWRYSYSVDVAGRVIELATGDPLDVVLRERIFAPLGMEDTGFVVPTERLERLASVYGYENRAPRRLESAEDTPLRFPPEALSAGGGWGELGSRGGLVSTAPDFMRLLLLLENGGEWRGVRLLSRKSVELMSSNHIPGMSTFLGPGVGFGLGVAVVHDPGARGELGSVGTLWWAGSCNTYFFLDPEEELIGVLMTQVRPFGHLDLMDRFMNLALAAIAD